MDLERDLAPTRAKDGAFHAHKVAWVELREQIEVALAKDLAAAEQLEATGLVLQIGEHRAAHQPFHHEPSGKGDRLRTLAVSKQSSRLNGGVRRFEAARVRIDTASAQPLELLAPVANYLWLVLLRHVPERLREIETTLERDLLLLGGWKRDHVGAA
jgi:hypothetical protein